METRKKRSRGALLFLSALLGVGVFGSLTSSYHTINKANATSEETSSSESTSTAETTTSEESSSSESVDTVADTLTIENITTGTSSTTYLPFSYEGLVTGIKYEGKMHKDSTDCIRLRSSYGSLCVTSNSGGYVLSSVQITVYGTSTASSTNLYLYYLEKPYDSTFTTKTHDTALTEGEAGPLYTFNISNCDSGTLSSDVSASFVRLYASNAFYLSAITFNWVKPATSTATVYADSSSITVAKNGGTATLGVSTSGFESDVTFTCTYSVDNIIKASPNDTNDGIVITSIATETSSVTLRITGTDESDNTAYVEVAVTVDSTTFTKVTAASDLKLGSKVIIASAAGNVLLGTLSSGYPSGISLASAITTDSYEYVEGAEENLVVFTLGSGGYFSASKNQYSLLYSTTTSGETYLSYSGSLTTFSAINISSTSATANSAWSIEYTDGVPTISNVGTSRTIRYNGSSDFRCYSSAATESTDIAIYQYTPSANLDMFANEFIEATSGVCANDGSGSEYEASLKDALATLTATDGAYTLLSDADKTTLTTAPSNENTMLSKALERYEHIFKVHSIEAIGSEFLGRNITASQARSLVSSEDTSSYIATAIIAAIMLSAIGGFIYISRKRKEER